MIIGLSGVFAQSSAADDKPTLFIYVGGTMRPAMVELCAAFTEETGIKTELNYGDSGSALIAIQTSGKGDACIVHDPFASLMEKKGLSDRVYTVAALTPVIVVPKGNPKGIKSVRDLVRPDLKVGLTDAMYSTGGHVVDVIFQRAGIKEAMADRIAARTRGGGELANSVKIGTLDVGIAWNAVVHERRDALDAISIEPGFLPDREEDAVTSATFGPIDMSTVKVTLVTINTSKHLESARRLAEFAMSEKGLALFARRGFSPAPKVEVGGTATAP